MMADAKLVKAFRFPDGRETELRVAETAKDTWPNYAIKLGKRGYWYGTDQFYKHIGRTEQEAREYMDYIGLEFTPSRICRGREERNFEMYRNLTWKNGYEVHLGLTGNRRAVIPKEIADNQQDYDGKTFKALLPDGRWMRVKLVGDDYGLNTPGTGDIIVRPLGYCK